MKSSQFVHGERNKDLCQDLLKNKIYYDWVVTTAFYSSIHLLEDKFLPTEIKEIKCTNIAHVRKAYNLKGRHMARAKLIEDKADQQISIKYKWLDDRSRYARYTTYKVQAAEAHKAEQYLLEIFKYCK
ncbi:hypothetical protein [Salinimicrobium oceani]|uniref:Uncharacterized protein n=1 Tax=Salinimicrobium oceani TaxID=2722702 RepID=A0ABX1CZX9_9FLAO|nr:hypothetical protein [Salinimicrobium oceani]NJW53817.1 hypothetical protein [Salinimicrobium oceani]